jgi:hypothetical protein
MQLTDREIEEAIRDYKKRTLRRDNKIRVSEDVLDQAEAIAQAWGMKNPRAAIEAVFRRYAAEYTQSRALTIMEKS